ncbi:hypothetical protein BGW36DRAFT_311236 [Talaromyces proteolyticus]|uniref:C2H2-type domain-containing protein n=1 Tax=Talaromyces proteolyticus TaxID=1131652 RepID=A0AAD4Q6R9_9EURO|nr:uncharacterized protein BGW36DRAFT_311236 [Talaromyces proteolyticus]KAH8705612.1 hypothetical protein BGW36DRAFT_311236 [Talaromyces proteolyticus]
MKVASLMTTEWSDTRRRSSSGSQPSPVTGTIRKYDEYEEKAQSYTHSYSHSHSHSYFAPLNTRASPQLPLSPPAEDQRKCSLPSISSLLEGANSVPAAKRARHNSTEYSRVFLPPTPPMRPCSGLAEGRSPSSFSRRSHSASVSSAPPMQQSQSQASLPSIAASLPTPPSERGSVSQELHMSPPAPINTTTNSSTYPAVASSSANSFTPTNEPQYPRAHSVSAPVTPSHVPPMISPVNPAWQHHHYFPPSGAASYPQNHDRYVCRTCHKAFSRPSSLRIHSHSHTGEKPFRCTHVGCGKAFSVRSNMKRHERGCHSGRPLAAIV